MVLFLCPFCPREDETDTIAEKLLPVLTRSAGVALDDPEISFPPLWTPTAKETAEIARTKSDSIIAAFQAGLLDAQSAMQELRRLSDETGMFGSITNEAIAANAGKTYQDLTALRDPLAGLTGGTADPFDSAVGQSLTVDYSPDQPRDENGRWTGGGSLEESNSTTAEKDDIIGLDNDRYLIAEPKISKFLLKPGAKHADEFFDVGYSEQDGRRLNADIYKHFDESLKTDVRTASDGTESFSIFMKLGKNKVKTFRTVWQRDPKGEKPRFITAHREDEK